MTTLTSTAQFEAPRLGARQLSIWIWLLMLASFLTVRQRDASALLEAGGFDLQVRMKIAAWFVFGLLALLFWAKGIVDTRLLWRAPLCWYAGFVVLAIASASYSTSPPLTLYRGVQLGVLIFLILAMREQVHQIHLYIFIFLVANWVLVLMANTGLDLGQTWLRGYRDEFMIFGRETQGPWRFGSPIAHPSQLSIVAAAGAVGLAMRTRRENLIDNLPIILLAAVTVLLTVSRTAIAAMLLGFIVVAIVRRSFVPLFLIAGISIPLALMFTPAGEQLVNYAMRGQSTEEFGNLTGRTEIYRLAAERASDSLPLGEGFQAGRAKAIVDKDVGHSIVHSHNLFFESTIGMGVLGFVLASLVLISLGRSFLQILKLEPDGTGLSPGWELVVMSIPILGFCILDRGFAAPVCPFVALVIAVLVIATRLLMQEESRRALEGSAEGSAG